VTKIQAYVDQQKERQQRIGLMHCFCKAEWTMNPSETLGMTFTDIDPEDRRKHCDQWFINYSLQHAMIIGTSVIVVLINVIICFIFELISRLEKHHTSNDETRSQF